MRNTIIEKGKLFRKIYFVNINRYTTFQQLFHIDYLGWNSSIKIRCILKSAETNKNEQRVVISICYVTFCAPFFVVRNLLREIFASELIIFGK